MADDNIFYWENEYVNVCIYIWIRLRIIITNKVSLSICLLNIIYRSTMLSGLRRLSLTFCNVQGSHYLCSPAGPYTKKNQTALIDVNMYKCRLQLPGLSIFRDSSLRRQEWTHTYETWQVPTSTQAEMTKRMRQQCNLTQAESVCARKTRTPAGMTTN